jgi:hypothetical protein
MGSMTSDREMGQGSHMVDNRVLSGDIVLELCDGICWKGRCDLRNTHKRSFPWPTSAWEDGDAFNDKIRLHLAKG